MSKSNQLFELIDTMTKSEKRYFKVSISGENTDTYYLKLFNILEKSKEYNEDKIIKKLGADFENKLDSTKNRLYNLILKSLRQFALTNSIKGELGEKLDYAEVLMDRGLMGQAHKIINKVKKQAEYYDFPLVNLREHEIRRKIARSNLSGEFLELYLDSKEYYQQSLKKFQIQNDLDELSLVMLQRRVHKTFDLEDRKKDTDTLFEKYPVIFQEPEIVWGEVAKGMHVRNWIEYYQHIQEYDKAIEKCDEMLAGIRDSDRIQASPVMYLRCIFILMLHYLEGEKYAKCHEVIKITKKYDEGLKNSNKPVYYRSQFFVVTQGLNIDLIIREKAFHKLRDAIDQFAVELPEHSGRFNNGNRLKSKYHVFYSNFILGDLNNAKNYMNDALGESRKTRKDLYLAALVGNIALYYELGYFDFIGYQVNSALYFYKNIERVIPEIEMFIKFFDKNLKDIEDSVKMKELFGGLVSDLSKVKLDQETANNFDILNWLKAKEKGITFLEQLSL